MSKLWTSARPAAGGYRDTDPESLWEARRGVRLVDVREPDEFTGPLGHIPGAELVPLGTVPEASAHWSRNEPVVLICRSGRRSATAAAGLAARGFSPVLNLAGGMAAFAESTVGCHTTAKAPTP